MNLRSRPLQQAPLMPRYPLYATPAGLHVHSLGSSPFARRYSGNHCCFLFLGVLRCFSSPGALLTAYAFSRRSLPTTEEGFPHSDTLGSMPAYGSPRHFGVRPVLLRHLAPRHPPCALPILSYSPADVRRWAASPRSLVRSRTQNVRSLFHTLRFLALLAPRRRRRQIRAVSRRLLRLLRSLRRRCLARRPGSRTCASCDLRRIPRSPCSSLMIRYLVVKEPLEASNKQAHACPSILQN